MLTCSTTHRKDSTICCISSNSPHLVVWEPVDGGMAVLGRAAPPTGIPGQKHVSLHIFQPHLVLQEAVDGGVVVQHDQGVHLSRGVRNAGATAHHLRCSGSYKTLNVDLFRVPPPAADGGRPTICSVQGSTS